MRKNQQGVSLPSHYRRALIPWVVFVGAIALTAAVAGAMDRLATAQDQLRFEATVRQAESNIVNRLETYIALLRSGVGLFAASREVERDEFSNWATQLQIEENYPGIQGVGFSRRILPEERDAVAEALRRQGIPDFRIWPETPRDEYHAIVYLQPEDERNRAAIGFDMFTEATRQAAMARARDTGLPSASGRVTLVQEIDTEKQPGFLLYLPIYRDDEPATEVERRAALVGFVYSPFRTYDFFQTLLGGNPDQPFYLEVYDQGNPEEPAPLFQSPGVAGRERPARLRDSVDITVAGRPWRLVFSSTPAFEQETQVPLSRYAFLLGLGFSGALLWLTRSQVNARIAAEESANQLRTSQEALRASESRLRQLIDTTLLGIILATPDGQLIEANGAFLTLTGYTRAELSQGLINWYRITPPEYALEDQEITAVRSAGPQANRPYEKELFRKDGSRVPVLVGSTVIPQESPLIASFILDLSASKEAERALARSEARFRRLVEANIIAVMVVTLEGQILEANDALLTMLGYTRPELEAGELRWLDMTPDEYLPQDEQMIQSLLTQGITPTFEKEYFHKNGSRVPLLLGGAMLPDSHDTAIAFLVDLSEQKRAEAALRLIADTSAALAVSFDVEAALTSLARLSVPPLGDLCLILLNGADQFNCDFTTSEALPPLDWAAERLEALCQRDQANPESLLARLMRTGEAAIYPDAAPLLADPSAHTDQLLALLAPLQPTSLMIVPMVTQERVLGAMILLTAPGGRRYLPVDLALAEELAHRAALAADNARLYHEAQEAIRIRNQFLSIASHELKTPITSVRGYVDLLLRRAEREHTLLDERSQRSLRVIQEQTARLQKLVDLLLDVSRIERGGLELSMERLDLAALVMRTVAAVEPILEPSHSLSAESAEEPLWIIGDQTRIEQVIQNLIGNAIKYSPEGGRVEVSLLSEGGAARLRVRDEGVGIPADSIPNLFSAFFRANNINHRLISGLGLGLHIVHHIVQAHGGAIEVESELGVGSTFTVILPLAAEPPAGPH